MRDRTAAQGAAPGRSKGVSTVHRALCIAGSALARTFERRRTGRFRSALGADADARPSARAHAADRTGHADPARVVIVPRVRNSLCAQRGKRYHSSTDTDACCSRSGCSLPLWATRRRQPELHIALRRSGQCRGINASRQSKCAAASPRRDHLAAVHRQAISAIISLNSACCRRRVHRRSSLCCHKPWSQLEALLLWSHISSTEVETSASSEPSRAVPAVHRGPRSSPSPSPTRRGSCPNRRTNSCVDHRGQPSVHAASHQPQNGGSPKSGSQPV
jgi:hypothetical protein